MYVLRANLGAISLLVLQNFSMPHPERDSKKHLGVLILG